MARSRIVLAALFALVAFATPSLAAEDNSLEAGKKVVSFALPSGGGALIGMGYFLSDTTAFRLDVGYALTIPKAGDNSFGFSLVPAYVSYLTTGRMATYIKGAVNITKQPGVKFGDALTMDLGGFFGAEFFLFKQFSVSGELGIAINFRDKFETITSQPGTGALFANFYF